MEEKERGGAENGAGSRICQYIIPRMVSEKYSDIVCYGVRIEKVTAECGGGRSSVSAQLDNVFFRYDDALTFVEYARRNGTEPHRLREAVERFTREHIMRGERAAVC